MTYSREDRHHDEAREQNLRLKLAKVIPQEEVDACENMAQLESKKAVLDAIEREARRPREMSEEEAIRFELESAGIELPIKV